jgi:hypothetical protein
MISHWSGYCHLQELLHSIEALHRLASIARTIATGAPAGTPNAANAVAAAEAQMGLVEQARRLGAQGFTANRAMAEIPGGQHNGRAMWGCWVALLERCACRAAAQSQCTNSSGLPLRKTNVAWPINLPCLFGFHVSLLHSG